MRLKKFILYSILFHLFLGSALIFFSTYQIPNSAKENIEISFIENNSEKIKLDDLKTIVDSDSTLANNQVSEKAKYLSEKSNSVAKETRAKSGQTFHNAQKFNLAKTPTKAAVPSLFNKSFDAYSALEKNRNSLSAKAAQAASEASSTNDNLKNIENDFITRLNTKEYKYYGYYNRIKTQLNQWWVPQVQQKFNKMLSQGRSIASDENKITKLVIILNESGLLVKVQVLAASGVRDLDDAAIEAFRQAAPFPNPPKGMIDSDGTVKIRWDCVVES